MDNRAKLFLILALVAGLAVTVLQACNLQEFVKLDAPATVRGAVGIPEEERLTVADSDRIWSLWQEWVAQNSYLLSQEIDASRERYDVVASLASTGLDLVSAQAATIPGGGFLVGGLAALGGLFLKDPRSRKREIEAYKQGLYNAGAGKE